MPVERELEKDAVGMIARGEVPILLDAAQNVVIAYTMGWEMDGVINRLRTVSFPDKVPAPLIGAAEEFTRLLAIESAAIAWRDARNAAGQACLNNMDDEALRHSVMAPVAQALRRLAQLLK